MRYIHKILLVLLWLPLPLNAQRIPINANLTPVQMFEKAQMMLSNGYTDKGLGYLQMSAGKHYLPALKFLAQCYLEGKYVPKDFQEAGNILVIAARLGDIDSSNKLAELSKSGRYHAKASEQMGNGEVVQIINQYNVVAGPTLESKKAIAGEKEEPLSDVDTNIPICDSKNPNTFVIIISNENYQEEVNVQYAIRDGLIFSEYCNKTLGIPKENIHFRKDATYNNIRMELDWIKQVTEAYNGNGKIIFYYAGHGFPDESSRSSYLLPIDGKGNNISTGYRLTNLYDFLGGLHAEKVWVLLDACFSGTQRGEGMLTAARGIAIKSKVACPKGNMVVFSAATGDETAYPYKEKKHGLFTYFLLKELQATKGGCTMGELADFIHKNVTQKSIVANGKSQTPVVTYSDNEQQTWRTIKLK